MVKTEVTVQVFEELKAIDTKLHNLGYSRIEESVIRDCYYTSLESIENKTFPEIISKSILLRERNCNTSSNSVLCYKNKKFDEMFNVISEEKTEIKISNIDEFVSLLDMANFHKLCEIKNNYFVYKKDEVKFAVQVVDNLGIFIELEEFSKIKELSGDEKFKKLSNIIKELGLKIGTDFSCKKVLMMINKTKNGI